MRYMNLRFTYLHKLLYYSLPVAVSDDVDFTARSLLLAPVCHASHISLQLNTKSEFTVFPAYPLRLCRFL